LNLHASKFGHSGGAAWRGRKDFTPLPVGSLFDRPPEAAVLARGLGIVAGFAERLPVVPVPEQLLVTTVRHHVIDDISRSDPATAIALRAQRVLA